MDAPIRVGAISAYPSNEDRIGAISAYPSSGELYQHPPAPPSYDAATASNISPHPSQVHTAPPQYDNTREQVYKPDPTIITTQPVFTTTVVAMLGSCPSMAVCQVCNCQVLTRVESKPSTMTHVCAGMLCITGMWLCVWLPYCTNSCYNIDHYCSTCNAHIGRTKN